MRNEAKTVVEHLLSLGPSRLSRWCYRRRTLILAYHNIVPDGGRVAGDSSLHLPQRAFARHLDLLLQICEVVPLEKAIDRSATGNGRPRVAITFDDAYQGAVSAGLDELSRRDLSATMFVAPGLLEGRDFWWDVLADPYGAGLDTEMRDFALNQLQGRDEEIREWARGHGKIKHQSQNHATGATIAQLEQATTYEGLTLGAHSWSHPNLAAISSEDLELELARPLEWLRARFSRVWPYLAYPYGLADSRVAQGARKVGYDACFRIDGGWLRPESDRWALPRLNVPSGISFRGFKLRLSGLFD
jgi:peptidoglycan/xylan/chitin deacetylase (PgdA/CDA1 family)